MHSFIQVFYLFTDSYQAQAASYCLPQRRSGPPAFRPYKASSTGCFLCK